MTLEELSERILNDNFGTEVVHSDEDPPKETFLDNTTEFLEHYGVKGMKWGVRKKRKPTGKKKSGSVLKTLENLSRGKNRRYPGETNAEYQKRMERESQERIAKIAAKEAANQQKRTLKSQEKQKKTQEDEQMKRIKEQIKAQERKDAIQRSAQEKQQKRMLKSQERQNKESIKSQERKEQENRKAQEKIRKDQEAERKRVEKQQKRESRENAKTASKPVKARTLTDKELNDAIQRLRNEQTYKQLSLQNKSLPKKTIIKAATIGGGILLAVGTAVAKKQLTDVGNQKASEFLEKKGLLKAGSSKNQQTQNAKAPSMEDIQNLINEAMKNYKG